MKKYGLIALMLALSPLSFANDEGGSDQQRAATRTSLASEYFRRGAYAVAIEEAKKALEAESEYPQALNVLAVSYLALKDEQSGRAYFERAVKAAPKDSDINQNYGNYLCERGEYRAGLARYEVVLTNKLYPTPDLTLIAAARCSLKAGDQVLAKQYFDRASKQATNNLSVKFQISEYLLGEGDLPRSKQLFMEVLRALPKAPSELLWLGVRIERKIGNKEAELRYANELKRNYPDSVEATKLLTGQYD
ncbi:tetratricopeptide repeat protein [Chitinibacter sp. SCUT-21]|uniref:tetratricopeptide repeat protein n=1 Tax=Chitinibacter sp. SCUT-21 TaxID=2970891 RepID=UPI0035A5ECF6